MASGAGDRRWSLALIAAKNNHPKTTKPSHFCEGFVLYGAAPGVEESNKYLNLNILIN